MTAGAQPKDEATVSTKKINDEVSQHLPFTDKQDSEDTRRGFMAPLPENGVILRKDGKPAWDLSAFSFIQEGASAPDTFNAILWRQSQLLMYAGLYGP